MSDWKSVKSDTAVFVDHRKVVDFAQFDDLTVGLELEEIAGWGNERFCHTRQCMAHNFRDYLLQFPTVHPNLAASSTGRDALQRWIIKPERIPREYYPDFLALMRAHELETDRGYAPIDPEQLSGNAYYDGLEVCHGVEFNTPVTPARALHDIVESLGKLSAALHRFCYTYTPDDRRNLVCGLHVHVGVGTGGVPCAQARRNVLAIGAVCEGLLDRMHPVHRTDPAFAAYEHVGSVIGDLLKNERRATWQTAGRPLSLPEEDALAWETAQWSTEEALARLVGDIDFYDYRFKYRAEYGTFEFRQAESTSDTEFFERWARVCVRIVQRAFQYSQTPAEGQRPLAELQALLLQTSNKDLAWFLYTLLEFEEDETKYWLDRQAELHVVKEAWQEALASLPASSPSPSPSPPV